MKRQRVSSNAISKARMLEHINRFLLVIDKKYPDDAYLIKVMEPDKHKVFHTYLPTSDRLKELFTRPFSKEDAVTLYHIEDLLSGSEIFMVNPALIEEDGYNLDSVSKITKIHDELIHLMMENHASVGSLKY